MGYEQLTYFANHSWEREELVVSTTISNGGQAIASRGESRSKYIVRLCASISNEYKALEAADDKSLLLV